MVSVFYGRWQGDVFEENPVWTLGIDKDTSDMSLGYLSSELVEVSPSSFMDANARAHWVDSEFT